MKTTERDSQTECFIFEFNLTHDRAYAECLTWGRAGSWESDVQLGLTSICRMWKNDAVFSHCGICTELHYRMYCCQIYINIHSVTISTVSTSRVTVSVTVSVTFTVFGHFVIMH